MFKNLINNLKKHDMKTIGLGTTVATPKGLGIVIAFGECVGSLLVELETGEKVEFLDRELQFLAE